MFVNVAVGLPARQQVVSIPATSVLYAPYGDSVFVVVDDKEEKPAAAPKGAPAGPPQAKTGKVLRQQFVRLGEKRGDLVAVNSGVKLGDTIVSTGVFKLRNGQSVLIDNKLAPQFQKSPTPENN
jgi:membrane fusion protein (multidrug efflux system)